MAFYNKLKWILGILMIFVLIVATNLIDRNNFVRVKDSVATIYEDRLIAKNLIFKISNAVHKKEVAIAATDSTFFGQKNEKVNDQIKSLIKRFEETKLTYSEKNIFNDFKKNFKSLIALESSLKKNEIPNKDEVVTQISSIKENLDDLGEIQLNEGSRQMSISKRAIQSVELFTQIEIYLLIILAIIIQIIVIYNPKKDTEA